MIEDSATSRTLLTAPVATAAAMCVGTIADIPEARAAEVAGVLLPFMSVGKVVPEFDRASEGGRRSPTLSDPIRPCPT
jgi:hypothetical protein